MDSQLDPIECPDQDCGGKEVSGKFVVARGDAAPIFDAAEVVFDFVAPSTMECLGNNNNAEHAVRAFTHLRNVIGTSTPKGHREIRQVPLRERHVPTTNQIRTY